MGSIKAFAVMNGSVHFHVSEDDVRAPHPIPPSPLKTVNVTVIAFALIMRQRKPCRASGFVNGPTDASLHFASEQKSQGFPRRDQPRASSASLLSLNMKGEKKETRSR